MKAPVIETMHGHVIADPHRWLENENDPDVVAWVEGQNEATRAILDNLPQRPAIRARLEALLSIGDIGTPAIRGRRYFLTRREGTQNHGVVYVRDGRDGKDRVLIDPNAWSEGGTEALDWWYPSQDGALVAYGRSHGGDEKSMLHVLDVATGQLLEDVIPRTRACSLAWLPDGSGFYYTRYPTPGTVLDPRGSAPLDPPIEEEDYNRRVYFHVLGTAWQDDPHVYGEGRAREDWANVDLSPDGRWLIISVSIGWTQTDVYVSDRAADAPPLTIVEGVEALYSGEIVEDHLYLMTNEDAPRYRLFKVALASPQRSAWREIVPQHESEVLDSFGVIGKRIFAHSMVRAASRLRVLDLEGGFLRDLEQPTLGSVRGFSGEWDGHEMFFSFNSYTVPPTIYHYDLAAESITQFDSVKADLSPEKYVVQQVAYPSRDGTEISMFLVHARDAARDGKRPTLLSGDGGFNISMTPGFQRSTYLWLEHGGLYAVPNLRGGGEYGESWHRDGMLDKKQNVFDDFISAAEWLIAEGWTSTEKLAISGGSNGGLLVGAALTQAPSLYRAVVCSVPLLDMLRYHQFRIARLWIPEYGSSEDAEQFEWLHAYSPYHRVVDGTPYPAVLIMNGQSDSRVDPLHARKMAARLQEATSSGRPVLLRLETKAGHGAGKPLSKVQDELTDTYSYLFWQLDVS